MNRVKEYIQFAVWFIGLGYIVLWPLTAHDNDIAALGATLICGDEPLRPADLLCNLPRALHLSPGLHLIGLMSAICVVARVLVRQLRRSRHADGEADPTPPAAASRIPAVLSRPAPQKPWCPPRSVKPRKNFGLRGVPH